MSEGGKRFGFGFGFIQKVAFASPPASVRVEEESFLFFLHVRGATDADGTTRTHARNII
jgi:hypothetical protein